MVKKRDYGRADKQTDKGTRWGDFYNGKVAYIRGRGRADKDSSCRLGDF